MSAALEKPQIIAHIQKSLNYTVFDSRWIPCSSKFVCMGNLARGSGVLQIYEIQRGELLLLREIEKAKPIKCGTFGATSLQQRHLATGDFDGTLSVWRVFDLPQGVNPEAVTCSMADGKLYIQAPVNQPSDAAERMLPIDCQTVKTTQPETADTSTTQTS